MEVDLPAGRREGMSASLRREILDCRKAIRAHRDARGDDRCWLDDYSVWALIKGSFPVPRRLPAFEEAMDMCRAFYKLRRAENADAAPPEAVADPALWDRDLESMDEEMLADALQKLHVAIRGHRDAAGAPLTLADDRKLYAALPENLPADFRLPPERDFLGEGQAPHAGCPSFWRSHARCEGALHDLHRWGPCK